jgi:hypothetical protein
VIRVDARAPFDKGRLVAQRRAPKLHAGDLPDPDPFDMVRGLDTSLWWDSVTKIAPAGLENVVGYLRSVAQASVM